MRFLSITFLIVCAMMASQVLAQPQITHGEGNWDVGGQVILHGNGFGSKSQPAPYKWDDGSSSAYANLDNGDPIPTRDGKYGQPQDSDAPWPSGGTSYTNPVLFRDTDYRVDGRPYYRVESNGYIKGEMFAHSGIMYASWWTRLSETSNAPNGESPAASNKLFRIWPQGDNHNGYISGYYNSISYECVADQRAWGSLVQREGTWTHVQLYIDSRNCTSDRGIIKAWSNGKLVIDKSDLSGPGAYHYFRLVGWDSNSPNYYAGKFYDFGEIYLDDTAARVLVGNNENLNDCTHIEMQIPQVWNNNQVTIDANLGSFNSWDEAYVFIFNENNQVNQTGFSLADLGGDPPEGPGQPGQPQKLD